MPKLLLSSVVLYLVCGGVSHAAEPPNIVLLISDDQAWTDYSFMGHEHIETPQIDKLAESSAVFTRGYVPTALCRPSLMTLATGLYAHQHRTSGNDPKQIPSLPARNKKETDWTASEQVAYGEYDQRREQLIEHVDQHATVPELLAERGYLSHQSGKWWEGSYQRGGFSHGMTQGFPHPGGRHGDVGLRIGREGMEPVTRFIDMAVKEERPFFVWYAPFMPHTPHTPPQRLFDKYKAKVDSPFVARYYAMCEWFDETCGDLLRHLDTRGLAENTLVIYVGDNGWIQKPDENGFAQRSKQTAYEGGVRQPIMFRWLGKIRPGDRGEQLCSSIDIVPTMLAAAGAEIPEGLPGFDLLPMLESGAPSPRQEVFGEGFAHDVAEIEDPTASLLYRWVVEGEWKLLLTYDGAVGRNAKVHPRLERRPQLFDLLEDPHEDANQAMAHPGVVARLAKRIADWYPVPEREVITEW